MTSDSPDNLWRHSHRADMDLPALDGDIRSDLLAIGGRFTGCSAALEAACNNADVVVL